MHAQVTRLFVALFALAATCAAGGVTQAQVDGGAPVGYVTEGGVTRPLTSGEATLDSAGLTPAEMEAFASHAADASIIHPIPKLPIIIDAVRYAPEDVSRFDGQILRYVLDERGEREGVIYGFTTVEGLMQYLKEQWGWEPVTVEAAPVVLQIDSDSYWTIFYENASYGGSTLSAAPNTIIPNLGNISPGWNDRISSVKVATGAAWATLYADIDYAGDQLWMQRGTEWSSLSGSGWDNRASSIKVWLQ